jgi:hypothetical protein
VVENTFNVDQSLWGRMSPSDMLQFNTIRAGQGGDAQRNSIAQTLMQQPQQASSGGQVQYSAPGPASVPAGYAPPGDNSDIPAALLGRMSPTDIALFRRAQGGQAIPTGVYGPYGGGAMGQPQIPSGYNAFSGAGLPPTNIGGGGLTDPGAGSGFFGGGLPYNPPPAADAVPTTVPRRA